MIAETSVIRGLHIDCTSLQWSRDRVIAETTHSSMNAATQGALQWSRDRVIAET